MPVWTLFLRDGVVWFVLVFGMSLHFSTVGVRLLTYSECVPAAGGTEVLIWSMRRETLKQLLVVYVDPSTLGVDSSHIMLCIVSQPRPGVSAHSLSIFGQFNEVPASQCRVYSGVSSRTLLNIKKIMANDLEPMEIHIRDFPTSDDPITFASP